MSDLHTHDGYAPHSHEVRADHGGVKRTTELPTIPVPLPHVPAKCGNCGQEADSWPLGVFAGQLQLTCRACHLAVARLVAVTDGHHHYESGPMRHDPFGYWVNL